MTMPGTAAASGSGYGQPAPATAVQIAIKNFAFSPATMTVRVGTTVTWTNEDSAPHTVTDKSGTLNSATLNTGATYKHTFTKPGQYPYICSIHPFMLATIVVTP
jgi:plastocyanin